MHIHEHTCIHWDICTYTRTCIYAYMDITTIKIMNVYPSVPKALCSFEVLPPCPSPLLTSLHLGSQTSQGCMEMEFKMH